MNDIIRYLSFSFWLCTFSRAVPTECSGSQARGLIGAGATSPRQSHSNVGSELRLRPTPQLPATLDPQPIEQGQVSNPQLMVPSQSPDPLSRDGTPKLLLFSLSLY